MKESNSSWSSNLSFLKIKKYPHLEKQGIQQRFLIINFVIEAIIKYYSLNATILKQISTDEKVDFYLLTDALKFILDNNMVVYHID